MKLLFIYLIATLSVFAENVDTVIAEFTLKQNNYYFFSINEGVVGKFRAAIGLRPVGFIQTTEAENNDIVYTFSVYGEEGQTLIHRVSRIVNFHKRMEQVKKPKRHEVEDPTLTIMKSIVGYTIPIGSVEDDLYSVNIYESDALDEIKKLPVSKLHPFFNWGAIKL